MNYARNTAVLLFCIIRTKGGDTAIMQTINDQYDRLSKKLINSNETFSEGRKEYEQQVSEEMRQRLDRIISLPGIVIELIGSWIWITGNTFPLRDTLKGEGYKFSHPKTAWYWHKGEYFKKSGKLMSMDDMRDVWGSERVEFQSKANYVN